MKIFQLNDSPSSISPRVNEVQTLPWPGSPSWADVLSTLHADAQSERIGLLVERPLTDAEMAVLVRDLPSATVWLRQADPQPAISNDVQTGSVNGDVHEAAVLQTTAPQASGPQAAATQAAASQAAEPQATAPTKTAPVAPPEKVLKAPTKSGSGAQTQVALPKAMSMGQLADQVFRNMAWGQDDIAQKLLYRLHEEIGCSQQDQEFLEKRRKQGLRARTLWAELEQKLKKAYHSAAMVDEVRQIIDAEQSKIVQWHLKTSLKRQVKFIEDKLKAREQKHKVQLSPVQWRQGQHPHSLRHLPVAQEWHVYIDETGSQFSEDALSEGDSKGQGKLVALVMSRAVRDQLKPIEKFHATNSLPADTDRMLSDLLQNQVGVLGIEVQDPMVLPGSSWFSSVFRLVEWVMRLLPLAPDQKTAVKFHIEERGLDLNGVPMGSHGQLLQAALQRLQSDRYGQCDLYLSIQGKKQCAHLAYVDALAHTWGSPSKEAKARLKQGQWLGHCFIRTDQQKTMRLYMAVQGDQAMLANDWFDTVVVAAGEPEHSILSSWLAQTGEHTRTDRTLWQQYQQEVQYRLSLKNYKLADIGAAVSWLERYMPEGHTLRPMERLHWVSNQIVHANHKGRVLAPLLEEAKQLSQALQYESVRDVCALALRMATALTNAFDFKAAQALLEPWTRPDMHLAIGTLNHAKALSSMGQNLAFELQPDVALDWFDRAIRHFETLSDAAQVARESQQTRIYRDICLCDDPTQGQALLQSLRKRNSHLPAYAKQLACSEEGAYAHHLLVRALVMHPDLLVAESSAYLSVVDQWESGDGHPWPLINFYRALLLLQKGENAAAIACAQIAIQACETNEDVPLLMYMGQVMRWLLYCMVETGIEAPGPEVMDTIEKQLPLSPHPTLRHPPNVSNITDLLVELHTLLPFNFH